MITTLSGAQKPNVLVFLVDDLKPSFGAYGDTFVKSPGLDDLASRGMRFDMAYCNQAVCAPSRNNLMTGARSSTLGIYNLGTFFRKKVPNAITLPQFFKQHGYISQGVGKVFHIGHGNVNDPLSWSVPFQKESPIEYLLEESNGGKMSREEALFSNKPQKGLLPGAAWEKADVQDNAYADGRIADEAIKRLQEAKKSKKPFFLMVGFTKPHLPFCAPTKYWDMYDPKKLPLAVNRKPPKGAPTFAYKPELKGELGNYMPINSMKEMDEETERTLIHGYYASLTYMDAQLARVMSALDQLKLSDNTIVVLWGDHGYHLGHNGFWTKHSNYEESARIPLIFVDPRNIAAKSSTQAIIETVDIYPTLADLAALPIPSGPHKIDGQSFASVLKGEKKQIRNHAYHVYPKTYMGRAIRTDRYRMVEWKSKKSKGVYYELYDYQIDPLETENLADKNPAVLQELKAILAEHPEAK
ncbi:sulfatase [Lentisphaera marina]|uniref:sulfatase n=1 Tax=Lentisphaera marina TaxID=1111041 RepID=UPI0023653775|nr:sulfatase [Lentisphaera marina]MDD7985235.1 sulfatase [Lentisphaera marina]